MNLFLLGSMRLLGLIQGQVLWTLQGFKSMILLRIRAYRFMNVIVYEFIRVTIYEYIKVSSNYLHLSIQISTLLWLCLRLFYQRFFPKGVTFSYNSRPMCCFLCCFFVFFLDKSIIYFILTTLLLCENHMNKQKTFYTYIHLYCSSWSALKTNNFS